MPSTMYNDAILVACMYLNIIVMLQVISSINSCCFFFVSLYNIVSDGSGYHYPLDRYFLIKQHNKMLLKPGN